MVMKKVALNATGSKKRMTFSTLSTPQKRPVFKGAAKLICFFLAGRYGFPNR